MFCIDFSIGPIGLLALGITLAFVPALYLVSRIRVLRGRNAIQFAVVYFAACAAFLALGAAYSSGSLADWLVGFMILQCAALLYLEAWALLSRGYTLGLLLTLHRAQRAIGEEELARLYRGGDGLAWIMKHRLAGLSAAHLVRVDNGSVTLTRFPGMFIARAYKAWYLALGLRKTG